MREEARKEIDHALQLGELRETGEGMRVIERIVRKELLAPLGLNPPNIPIYIAPLGTANFSENAGTSFDPVTNEPLFISVNEHFIRWTSQGDILNIIGTIAHELTHAALPYSEGHSGRFAEVQNALGMIGPPDANIPGLKLREWAQKNIVPELDKLLQHTTL